MSKLEFLASIVSSILSIPTVLLVAVLVFRAPIRQWLKRLPSTVKLGPAEFHWDQRAQSLHEDLTKAQQGQKSLEPVDRENGPLPQRPSRSEEDIVPSTGGEPKFRNEYLSEIPKLMLTNYALGHEAYALAYDDPTESIVAAYEEVRSLMRLEVEPLGIASQSSRISAMARKAYQEGAIGLHLARAFSRLQVLYEDVNSSKVEPTTGMAFQFLDLAARSLEEFIEAAETYGRRAFGDDYIGGSNAPFEAD
jgi:hypothetical protein